MKEINLTQLKDTKSNIRTFIAEIEGLTPISFSRPYTVPKLNKESPDAYEQRTWMHRLHFNKEGECFVPAQMIQKALVSTAAFLSIKVVGKGQATYTKNFERGILVLDDMPLGINYRDVKSENHFVPSDGKKGSGRRVHKNFPVIYTWGGTAKIEVIDDSIPEEVFARVLVESGRFNGWGRFRPQTGGYCGRFEVKKLSMSVL